MGWVVKADLPTFIAHLRAALAANDAAATATLLDALEALMPADDLADLLERLLAETEPPGLALMA